MRYAAGHKEQTREKILKAAGKVFRRQGYHASGVDSVMEEAGLTAGGFYAHFGSKEALLAEVLAPAAAEASALRDEGLSVTEGLPWVEAFLDRYLSHSHFRRTENGCPLPTLVSEIARAGAPVKTSFETLIRKLASRLKDQAGNRLSEDRALAIVALCVGALGVARSVQDETLGERIITACREMAKAELLDTTSTSVKSTAKRKDL